ncbi:MAG TPA: FkbM family methyltransferase [Victivallales bacterium]|nr:FkbM family methyltransferase [Victivallales bacterium]
MIKQLVKKYMPNVFLKPLIYSYRKSRETNFFNQNISKITIGNFELQIPSNHLLIELQKNQPYRDLNIGITAKYISEKYPESTIIDVGANIGDTAAIIATYSKNDIILIEPSEFYYNFLNSNKIIFPNNIKTIKALVSDGKSIEGSFHHWGGTAIFSESNDNTGKQVNTISLEKVTKAPVCFIKVDTDGYDFKIINNSIKWFPKFKPAILFENQILDENDLSSATEVLNKLNNIGYKYFVVWDDQGLHLVSTNSIDIVNSLNNYLFKLFQLNKKRIYNYDILCLNSNDYDIFEQVTNWYKSY